jgi:hypothetical protein
MLKITINTCIRGALAQHISSTTFNWPIAIFGTSDMTRAQWAQGLKRLPIVFGVAQQAHDVMILFPNSILTSSGIAIII